MFSFNYIYNHDADFKCYTCKSTNKQTNKQRIYSKIQLLHFEFYHNIQLFTIINMSIYVNMWKPVHGLCMGCAWLCMVVYGCA